jgi:hypothetical protein
MPMKVICRALALALLLAPAAYATKVPIPIEGATLNVSVQIQSQMQINQNGTPDGTNPSYDFFMRRTRILVNGDISQNFTYLFQIDNANFGKFGNFALRAIIQDAWVGFAPGGITGGSVLYFDAGILLIPISHQLLMSTTNFVTADVQTDGFRFLNNNYQGLRDTGIQIRGWALDKKIGFRGGVYEGNTPASVVVGGAPAQLNQATAAGANVACTPATCITPKRNPMFGGFINFNIIGSEEGGWLYGAYKWGKDPILSVGFADNYQSLAVRNFGNGNLNDQNIFSADVYLNLPLGGEAGEVVLDATYYQSSNGGNSGNTGQGVSAALGTRFGKVGVYVAGDYFSSQDCDTTAPGVGATTPGGTLAIQTACLTGGNFTAPGNLTVVGPHGADTREAKVGLTYWFNKNLNHMNLEWIQSHGQSTYGAGAITAGNAGYAPLALDPIAPSTTRRAFNANLRNQSLWTILYHWNVFF